MRMRGMNMGITRFTGCLLHLLLSEPPSHHLYPHIRSSGSRVGVRSFFRRWYNPRFFIYYSARGSWRGNTMVPEWVCQLCKKDVVHVHGESGSTIQCCSRRVKISPVSVHWHPWSLVWMSKSPSSLPPSARFALPPCGAGPPSSS
jgi:hypothetical protein